MMTLRACLS